jgi:hypothetical protein
VVEQAWGAYNDHWDAGGDQLLILPSEHLVLIDPEDYTNRDPTAGCSNHRISKLVVGKRE